MQTAIRVSIACLVAAPVISLSADRAAAGGGELRVTVVDRQTKKPIPCRMHLKNKAGRPRKVGKLPFWHDHFVLPGEVTLRLPLLSAVGLEFRTSET